QNDLSPARKHSQIALSRIRSSSPVAATRSRIHWNKMFSYFMTQRVIATMMSRLPSGAAYIRCHPRKGNKASRANVYSSTHEARPTIFLVCSFMVVSSVFAYGVSRVSTKVPYLVFELANFEGLLDSPDACCCLSNQT